LKDQVVLLGNGINDVTENYKWSDLVNDLINYVGIKRIRLDEKKPFPLIYEEIYLTNPKSQGLNEHKLKSFIAEKLRIVGSNDVHKRIISLGVSDILTTNYDYAIENANGDKAKLLRNDGVVQESLFSVFRHTQTSKTNIWHIHGEINSPTTIMLGYEQYSGQLQHIRSYVVSGTGNQYKYFRSPSLVELIMKGKIKNNSWLDLFFTEDIHIVGLTLDFVEMDLWWLLIYRARSKLEGKFPIKNTITYYYPGKFQNDNPSKLELLRANGIITKPIANEHNLNYYDRVFDYINRHKS
jgi:hypothetical protein